MARAILVAGALVWGLAALSALVVALAGAETLMRILPPLAIDTDALRGAILAVTVGLGLVAAAHMAVVLGLRGRARRARSAGILLVSVLSTSCTALAVAGITSALVTPASAPLLLGAGLALGLAAVGYALATVALVREQRSGSAS